jgi:hypothetical protein
LNRPARSRDNEERHLEGAPSEVHMLSLFKKPLFNRDKSATPADPHALRLAAYERELGEPESDPGDRRSTAAISCQIAKRVRMKVTFC